VGWEGSGGIVCCEQIVLGGLDKRGRERKGVLGRGGRGNRKIGREWEGNNKAYYEIFIEMFR